jgi:hypothetical protein
MGSAAFELEAYLTGSLTRDCCCHCSFLTGLAHLCRRNNTGGRWSSKWCKQCRAARGARQLGRRTRRSHLRQPLVRATHRSGALLLVPAALGSHVLHAVHRAVFAAVPCQPLLCCRRRPLTGGSGTVRLGSRPGSSARIRSSAVGAVASARPSSCRPALQQKLLVVVAQGGLTGLSCCRGCNITDHHTAPHACPGGNRRHPHKATGEAGQHTHQGHRLTRRAGSANAVSTARRGH